MHALFDRNWFNVFQFEVELRLLVQRLSNHYLNFMLLFQNGFCVNKVLSVEGEQSQHKDLVKLVSDLHVLHFCL